ncbi:flagellar basal body L-ring protein FlgH [Pleionea sediminis]|uniref:flagellar basal body L-ring protein FlgH n=1 Tax=Pleionea sediminis TaxID=2569479 RepID=UPI001186ACD7|nr:flagellar basal body L-ring protein FlgH [Pleionea sediminis]
MIKNLLLAMSIMSVINVCSEDLFDANNYKSLTEDNKAYRVGDTVTVLIFERTTAESSANTVAEREFNLKGQAFDNTRENDLGVGIGKGTEGDAVTRRNGFVSGTITALVTEKSDVGLLKIEGVQSIVLNGEKQSINIKGYVRREDINANNTVVSNRLTNAEIEFIGKGIVSDAQKPGWIATVFEWLGII